ncbi:MAG: aminodeoxychorismate lyase [Microgenomates group bacterium GW2011_GWC1_43_13]|uniref:Endolytic murein transglycosylase n=1 Tax=Candidatus Woesebacteria bacterium GW2011_GWA1_44_23 TaxID=1618558 RepID=A0A837I909_9BACT|nr:MAG: aminodeoxychorismate lyase [Microgenomates group bacterium GW2011_GWC1_43_13]KKT54218.1 MAG: Aminodeoxychorismate lyase [Candidatus Woesebacteria bacterium GW2011_GWA1_44_23]
MIEWDMKVLKFILIPTATFLILYMVWSRFGSVGDSKEVKVFVVPENTENFDVSKALQDQKFIRDSGAFQFLLDNFSGGYDVKAGGYRLSQDMNAWAVMKKITGNADLVWFTESFCVRREQLGEYLADALNWNDSQLVSWNSFYKNLGSDYFEGVYYPDTYLIPLDETPEAVAQRFINNFNQKMSPLLPQFADKNIKWTTGVKIASLIAREAAGAKDMKLISGIIWNRLDTGMRLQIDATMQYTLGKNENGKWWGSVNIAEKKSDSPYNSYLNEGLPPTPICSPGIDAIEAALNPETTECLYYLHDVYKEIHCAKTYKEHLANIDKYLNY